MTELCSLCGKEFPLGDLDDGICDSCFNEILRRTGNSKHIEYLTENIRYTQPEATCNEMAAGIKA